MPRSCESCCKAELIAFDCWLPKDAELHLGRLPKEVYVTSCLHHATRVKPASKCVCMLVVRSLHDGHMPSTVSAKPGLQCIHHLISAGHCGLLLTTGRLEVTSESNCCFDGTTQVQRTKAAYASTNHP